MRVIRLSRPGSVNSGVAGSRWKVFLLIRQTNRQQVGRTEPFRSRRRRATVAAAQEQQTAAAAVDELLDQILLGGGEIVRFHAAQNDALEAEQVVHFGGEAVLQFARWRIRRNLRVQLVLRGSDEADTGRYSCRLPPRGE